MSLKTLTAAGAYGGLIEKYREHLPVSENTPVCTLLEGNTPLIPSAKLGSRLGIDLYYKFEGLNPTASFKDRGMTVAVSKALEEKAKAVICASTGNTSASAAAYAARAGLSCYVVIPEGKIARGKLAQAQAHGAKVVALEGNFDQALKAVLDMVSRYPIALVNSLNPFRLEGQKTAAFEICDALGESPEYLVIPVGNAGNITAYWKGFNEYKDLGKTTRLPAMVGFQAAGAAPLVLGHPVEKPETLATAIRIGNPARGKEAMAAVSGSRGSIGAVTDEEIVEAYRYLAREEGIFVEPASAASVAGIIKLAKEKHFPEGSVVTAILTGHGLKDPDTAQSVTEPPLTCKPDLDQLVAAFEL